MFMNSTTLSTESTEGITAVRSVEHLEDPQHYRDEPFAPSQEAYSFTWDIKDDRTVVESNKPKRRKLTASERARTKALKLAGGACENCRRKKKKVLPIYICVCRRSSNLCLLVHTQRPLQSFGRTTNDG
jgi:hypothetical protein